MSDPKPRGLESPEPDPSTNERSTPEQRRAHERRRLAEIFGDVLPDATTDDRSEGAGNADSEPEAGELADRRRDAELLRDVPPHH